MLQELNVLLIDTRNVSILRAIMLKNVLSNVVFVVSFSRQLVHVTLCYVVGIFIFGMTVIHQEILPKIHSEFNENYPETFLSLPMLFLFSKFFQFSQKSSNFLKVLTKLYGKFHKILGKQEILKKFLDILCKLLRKCWDDLQ